MLRLMSFSVFMLLAAFFCKAQTDSTGYNPKWDYQLYLRVPGKEIKELLYDNTCEPVDGRLSDDGKAIIMKNYQKRGRIYVKAINEDGSIDEFIRSSCFIDPVI